MAGVGRLPPGTPINRRHSLDFAADVRNTGAVEQWILGDIRVAVHRAGCGPRVVMVHGLAQDHTVWKPFQKRLEGHSTIAYDVRGHGGTALGDADATLGQLGGDLVRLLERLGPSSCIGYSLGGVLVLWAAAHRSDLVERAAVLGTSTVVGSAAAAFYAQRIDLVASGERDAIEDALVEDTAAALHKDADVRLIARERLDAIGDGGGYRNAAQAMASLHEHPLTDELENVRCPVLVVGAEHDRFCPRKAADIMLARLPRASYAEIPDAGHLMTVDQPDAVTRVLRDFLSDKGTAGAA